MITALGWVGFMTTHSYTAAVVEQIAGFGRSSLTWILEIVGLVLGNSLEAAAIPFTSIIAPIVGLLFIIWQERRYPAVGIQVDNNTISAGEHP